MSQMDSKPKEQIKAFVVHSIHLPSLRISKNMQILQEDTVYNEKSARIKLQQMNKSF